MRCCLWTPPLCSNRAGRSSSPSLSRTHIWYRPLPLPLPSTVRRPSSLRVEGGGWAWVAGEVCDCRGCGHTLLHSRDAARVIQAEGMSCPVPLCILALLRYCVIELLNYCGHGRAAWHGMGESGCMSGHLLKIQSGCDEKAHCPSQLPFIICAS